LTYRCVGKVVTVECSDDEEDAEEENFFRREEISRAAGERWRAAEATDGRRLRWHSFPGLPFLPPVSSGPRFAGAFGNRAPSF